MSEWADGNFPFCVCSFVFPQAKKLERLKNAPRKKCPNCTAYLSSAWSKPLCQSCSSNLMESSMAYGNFISSAKEDWSSNFQAFRSMMVGIQPPLQPIQVPSLPITADFAGGKVFKEGGLMDSFHPLVGSLDEEDPLEGASQCSSRFKISGRGSLGSSVSDTGYLKWVR